MSKELIIDNAPNETVIALLNEKRLVELHREKSNKSFNVGDIYLGKVKKVMPGLNAAFVDVGYEKDAFLHYLDLGPQVLSLIKFVKTATTGKGSPKLEFFTCERDIHKDGKITQIVQSGMHVLVQIAKEPISSKGPRITSEISLAGRYVVLVPFSDKVSVSQKIREKEERDRLKKLVQGVLPANYGAIIRTVAENRTVAELHADLNDLISKWESIFNELTKAAPPQRVLGEIDRTNAILRDLLNESFSAIHVKDQKMHDDMKGFLHQIAPDKEKILKLYKGTVPIFDHFGVDKQVKALFGKHVTMRSGGYLIIEHTEAMHVVDVNSGNRARSDNSQEANALEVNLEAAAEIARQLRLRDMGGIIVVDFIDLHNPDNRKKLFEKLKNEMRLDRAKHNILPPSKFGLVQITRQRVRPEMNVVTAEKCPACGGSGEIQASVLLLDQIENDVKYIMQELNEKRVVLAVHPFLESHLTRGWFTMKGKWAKKYGGKLEVKGMNNYHFLEYHFFNRDEEEIKI
ncbi:MAG: Rne/Rng family ribonuclease [Bacteroidia bacterium]|nr:Rne/Rng family ribonuclease [Bacteroidia bacterium]